MKKLIVLALSTMLLITPVFASVDLGSMSDQELVDLKTQVTEEMIRRGSIDVLPKGTYLVGTDLKAGKYTFTGIGDDYYYVGWYACKEDEENDNVGDYEGLSEGNQAFFDLSDGMIFYNQQEVMIEPTVASWAP